MSCYAQSFWANEQSVAQQSPPVSKHLDCWQVLLHLHFLLPLHYTAHVLGHVLVHKKSTIAKGLILWWMPPVDTCHKGTLITIWSSWCRQGQNNNNMVTWTACLTIDRSEMNFLFRNDLKLDISDFKQVCDIIVNNLFMSGITQIGIIMTTTANHTLYSKAFARADLIPLWQLSTRRHPSVYQAFCYGGSVVHKHMTMQAHQQCNAMVKGNGGAVGLASLRRVLFVNLHDYI